MATVPTDPLERQLRALYLQWLSDIDNHHDDIESYIEQFKQESLLLLNSKGAEIASKGALAGFPAPTMLEMDPVAGYVYDEMQVAAIKAGIAAGLNARDTARRMLRTGLGTNYKKLERIARTETVRAYWKNTWDSARGLDLVMVWSVEHSARTCDYCKERDGLVVEDESIRDHPNGRCTLIPMLPSMVKYKGTLKPDGTIYHDKNWDKPKKKSAEEEMTPVDSLKESPNPKSAYWQKRADSRIKQILTDADSGRISWEDAKRVLDKDRELFESKGVVWPSDLSSISTKSKVTEKLSKVIDQKMPYKLNKVDLNYDQYGLMKSIDHGDSLENYIKQLRLREASSATQVVTVDADFIDHILSSGRIKGVREVGQRGGFGVDEEYMLWRDHVEFENMGIPVTTPARDMPIYGWLETPAYSSASMHAYGSVDFIMKPGVKSRSTVSFGDSFAGDMTVIPMKKVKTASEKEIISAGADSAIHLIKNRRNFQFDYWETQIHGGVDILRDVDHVRIRLGDLSLSQAKILQKTLLKSGVSVEIVDKNGKKIAKTAAKKVTKRAAATSAPSTKQISSGMRAADREFKRATSVYKRKLSKDSEARDALDWYTSDGYSAMNALLRNPNLIRSKVGDLDETVSRFMTDGAHVGRNGRFIKGSDYLREMLKFADKLSGTFGDVKLEKDVVTMRGVVGTSSWSPKDFREGEIFADPGFFSTTPLEGVVKHFTIGNDRREEGNDDVWTFVVRAPKGTPFIPGRTDHSEIILSPGTKQRIVEIDRDKNIIYTEVTP